MKWINPQRLVQKSKNYLEKASPTILSCLGAVGVFTTAAIAVWVTPKAIRRIEADSRRNHAGNPKAYSKQEAIQSAWVCYIPASISGVITVFCIMGANTLSKNQQAAITSAYALLNDSYHNYKLKLKELYGEDAHQKILDSLAAERADDVYISADGLCNSVSLSFGDRTPEDIRLFYDTFSRRYFESTIERVLEAEYHLNRNWALGANVSLNDFYAFLGLVPVEGGDELGWFYEDGIAWIDFDHHKTVLDDGLEVHVIDIVYAPRLDTD